MSADNVQPLVERAVYLSPEYNTFERFASYGRQLSEIWATKASVVLEVGLGNGLIAHVVRNAGIQVTTLDIDPNLEPDIVGSVECIPLRDDSFEAVTCFEVLEHLRFEKFVPALRELRRVSAQHVILSLPDVTPVWRFCTPRCCGVGGCFLTRHPFRRAPESPRSSSHYWEIGIRAYSLRGIVRAMGSAGLRVVRTYRVWENPYHRMFVLRK